MSKRLTECGDEVSPHGKTWKRHKLVDKSMSGYAMCEYHIGHGADIDYVRLLDDDKENHINKSASKAWYFDGFFASCRQCRNQKFKESYVYVTMASEKTAVTRDIIDDKISIEIVNKILEIRRIFSDHVKDIYLIPSEYSGRFSDKTNILLRIKGLDFLSFLSEATGSGKTLMDFWNDDDFKKDKFWSVRLTKLMMTLCEIHHNSSKVKIWVQGYSKIVSVELFSKMRMHQAQPKYIVKLTR